MAVETIVGICSGIVALLVAGGGIFNFAVIRPLERSIESLGKEIAELRKDRERVHQLEIQIAELILRIKSTEHRLLDVEGKHHEMGH